MKVKQEKSVIWLFVKINRTSMSMRRSRRELSIDVVFVEKNQITFILLTLVPTQVGDYLKQGFVFTMSLIAPRRGKEGPQEEGNATNRNLSIVYIGHNSKAKISESIVQFVLWDWRNIRSNLTLTNL